MARLKRYKYKINPHTLAYERVRISFKERLKEVSFGVAFGVVVAAIITIVSYNLIDSPKEKVLKREIAQYKHQIDILNKRTEVMSGCRYLLGFCQSTIITFDLGTACGNAGGLCYADNLEIMAKCRNDLFVFLTARADIDVLTIF